MTKPKRTIFASMVDGQPRRILAVQEASSGDVRLLPVAAESYEDPMVGLRKTKNQYWSLHRPQLSGNNVATFKMTLELTDGDTIDAVSVSSLLTSGKFHLLNCRRLPNLTDRYAAVVRDKDDLIPIGSFSSKSSSMIVAVVVSRSGQDLGPVPPAFTSTYVDCQVFRVTLLWAYLYMPSHHTGDYLHTMTGIPRLNKQPVERVEVAHIEGDTEPELWSKVQLTVELLRRRMSQRVLQEMPLSGVDLLWLLELCSAVHREPLDESGYRR